MAKRKAPADFDFDQSTQIADDGVAVAGGQGGKAKKIPETVLQHDRWSLRRGKRFNKENTEIKKLDLDDHAVADVLGACFEPDPKLNEQCTDQHRMQFMGELFQTVDFQSLRKQTVLDALYSEIASVEVAKQYKEYIVKHGEEEVVDQDGNGPDGQPGKGNGNQDLNRMRNICKAISQAQKEVGNAQEAMASFAGTEHGAGSQMSRQQVAELFKKFRKNDHLKRISQLIGRMRRLAIGRQQRKLTHDVDDIVGIKLGGDVGQLLPSELVALSVPAMKQDAVLRMVNQEALVWDRRGTHKIGKGPIVIFVDESGSMSGDRIDAAKAVAVTLAWIARQQKRWACLVSFSGKGQVNTIILPPTGWDPNVVADWTQDFMGGGTQPPLGEIEELCRQTGAPDGKTDVCFISDGDISITPDECNRFLDWKKKHGSKMYTLLVQSESKILDDLSDELWKVNALTCEVEAVGEVFGLV